MDILLWVLQLLLALAFTGHALMLFRNTPPANPRLKYIGDMPPVLRWLVGAAEVLAAAGLLLPSLTHILPVLTPLAAIGLILVMAGAMFFHFQRKEYPAIGFNFVLLLLALIVAYGRFALMPIV